MYHIKACDRYYQEGKMTKSELIERVSEAASSLPRNKAESVVNVIFVSMVQALQDGERIEIRGLGSFTIRERNARAARNPKTGDTVKISARKIPFFKTGKELRERVDNL
jgi:integration host factor subunit beta